MPLVACFIMLAGIYMARSIGGSTTAILLGCRARRSSVVTAIDGHEMAAQGPAGKALANDAIGSFIAGHAVGVRARLLLAAAGGPRARLRRAGIFRRHGARAGGRLVVLASARRAKRWPWWCSGFRSALLGRDQFSGEFRLTSAFELSSGFDFVAVTMGLFAVSRWCATSSDATDRVCRHPAAHRPLADVRDLKAIFPAVLRGTGIGAVPACCRRRRGDRLPRLLFGGEGMPPGTRRSSQGRHRGRRGPESANNAAAQSRPSSRC